MAGARLSRAEALALSGPRHACHALLYSDTESKLFGRIPMRHIVLMQMRFDGLLGFPGGLVDPAEETLEAGLSRELLEELGMDLTVSEDDHVESCFAPPLPPSSSPTRSSSSSSGLILHFYVKKMEEEQIREVERAAASTAVDHGHEVLGMVRVPLYTTKRDGGLSNFLSHSFIGNARSQLIDSLLRLNLVSAGELHRALARSLHTHKQSAADLRAAVARTDAKRHPYETHTHAGSLTKL